MTQKTAPAPLAESQARIESLTSWVNRQYGILEQWVTAHWVEVMIAAVAGFIIYLVLSAIRRWAKLRARNADDHTALPTLVWRVIGRTGRVFRTLLSLALVVELGQAPARIVSIILFLFTIATVWQVAIWVREIIIGFVERKASHGSDNNEALENAMTLIRLLVTVAVFAIAAIVILDNLGVDVTGLIAGLGVGGIAIGLAAQGIFSDLFAALSIIFDKPFRRGEVIRFDDMSATVEKIGLKSTRLRSLDGQEVIVSNTNLLDKQIENLTKLSRRRGRFQIGVIYQTPPEKARQLPEILREIIETHNAIPVRAGFIGFGDSSIDFEMLFDVTSADYMDFFEANHKIGLDIYERFAKEGIEFAYPTQTTFTAAPDGEMILPYPNVQAIKQVEDG